MKFVRGSFASSKSFKKSFKVPAPPTFNLFQIRTTVAFQTGARGGQPSDSDDFKEVQDK